MNSPELIAHRGYTRHYPENTLAAIDAAIATGARFVEIDVQMSADGVPVLFHDADLMRVCGVSGAVADRSLAQLRQLRASEPGRFGDRYADVRIPTLGEFVATLQRHPHVTAFVELKIEALARVAADQVLRRMRADLAPISERAVLISYVHDALAQARRDGWESIGVVVEPWDARNLPIMRAIAPQFVFADVNDLPNTGRLDVKPAKLAIFEVVDADIALDLARRGADMIETFAIGELKQQLADGAAR